MTSKGSLTSIALGGAAFNVGLRIGGVVISIASMSILARLLSPTEYGLFGIIVLCVAVATIPTEAISNAIVQHRIVEGNEIGGAFTLVCGAALGMAILVFFFLGVIELFFRDMSIRPYAPVLYLLILLNSLGTFFDAVQAKFLKFRRVAIVEFVTQGVFQAVVSVALALAGAGAWSLLIGLAAAALGKVGIQIAMGMGQHVRLRLVRGNLLPAIGWFVALQAANFVGRNGDNAVVGSLLGPAALGIYGRAYNLMMRPVTTIGGVVVSVFYPLISAIDSDLPRVRSGYLKALAIAALLALPAAAFATIHASEIVLVLLGGGWTAAIPPFQILAAALYFRLAYRVTETLTFSRGALKGATLRQIFYGAAVIIAAALGAYSGVSGVALGVSIALALFFVLSASFANRISKTSAKEFFDAHLPGLVIALVVTAVTLPLRAILLPLMHQALVLVIDMSVAGIVLAAAIFLPPLFRGSPIEGLVVTARRRLIGRS